MIAGAAKPPNELNMNNTYFAEYVHRENDALRYRGRGGGSWILLQSELIVSK